MSLPEGWVQNFGDAVSRQDGPTQVQYASPTPLARQPQWQPKANATNVRGRGGSLPPVPQNPPALIPRLDLVRKLVENDQPSAHVRQMTKTQPFSPLQNQPQDHMPDYDASRPVSDVAPECRGHAA
jgi:hypothetical protein